MDRDERTAKHRTRAVTLIEVMIIAAFVTLLLAMILPATLRLRSPASTARCLSNLRQITQAASSYVMDNGTLVFAFPFGYQTDNYNPNCNLITEFIWGGGVPDKTASEWDADWGFNPVYGVRTDVYCITPADRPLNDYLSPGVWWNDPERRKGHPSNARIERPMQLPDLFKCPSDEYPLVPGAGGTNPDFAEPADSTWEWWGTSYAINWYWVYCWQELAPPGGGGRFAMTLAGESGSGFPGLGPDLIAEKLDHGASEFALFYENRMNFALENARPRGAGFAAQRHIPGWHGEMDCHVAGFLDGSARYQRFDTAYDDGPGWTLWPNRPWTGLEWEEFQDY